MNNMRIILLIGILCIAGCKHLTSEQRYINYINDPENKITQQIKIGDVQATVKWLPPQYRKLKNSNEISDLISESSNDFYFFDVRFDKPRGDKPGKEKIAYLNFDMQNDFVLLSGVDSIMPAICQKIENGISGSYQYILAFEKASGETEDFLMLYSDKSFGIGSIAFVYRQDDISKIPELKNRESK
jgi:hypothetical protein